MRVRCTSEKSTFVNRFLLYIGIHQYNLIYSYVLCFHNPLKFITTPYTAMYGWHHDSWLHAPMLFSTKYYQTHIQSLFYSFLFLSFIICLIPKTTWRFIGLPVSLLFLCLYVGIGRHARLRI